MDERQYIPLKLFCAYHNIEIAVITSLVDIDVFTVVVINDEPAISIEEIGLLESVVRLHTDLAINAEGLHAIVHLQDKIKRLQEEVSMLKDRLRFYES